MHVYLHSYLYLISVSELVSIYCYRHTTAITILLGHLRHTKSQQSPLPRGGQMLPRRSRPTLNRSGCSPTRVRRGWVPPHSIPSVRGLQAEEHRSVRAASPDGKRRWTRLNTPAVHTHIWGTQQILQFLEVSLRMWQKMTFSTLLLLAYGPCKVYQGPFLKLSQT